MALIKYSALVAEARGKLGDVVLSRNTYGAYVRSKGVLIDPTTARQLAVRARLTTASQAWRVLTDSQRLAWHDASQRASRHNVFGDQAPLSGNNFFIKKYLRAVAAGVPPPTNPPRDFAPTAMISIGFYSLSEAGGIGVVADPTSTGSDHIAFIWAATNISAGRNFVSSQYRLVYTVPEDTDMATDITAECNAFFGPLVRDQKAFIRIGMLSLTSLSLAGSLTTSQIIGA